MDTKKLIASVVLVVAVIAAYFLFFYENDKKAVQKRFETILESVEKVSGEGNISMVAKHQTLSNSLAAEIEIFLEKPSISNTYTREDAMSNYARLRQLCKTVRLSVSAVEITIVDSTTATLTCYGSAVCTSKWGDSIDESRPAILTFIKKDGKWLLAKAKENVVFK